MNATGTYVLVGAAIGAPMLLVSARNAGLPVPAFVTDAHRAACATLQGPLLGVAARDARGRERMLMRFLEVRTAMLGLRGVAVDGKGMANLTDDDITELCTRFLAAVEAGTQAEGEGGSRDGGVFSTIFGGAGSAIFESVLAGSGPAHQYRVTVAPDIAGIRTNTAVFGELVAGSEPSFPLTSLGVAVQRVVALRRAAEFGSPSPVEAQQILAHLAVECDDIGYLVTGDPARYETIGVGESLKQSGEFLATLPGKGAKALAGLVGDQLAAIAMSTPGLLVIVGLIAWRKFR